MILAILDVHSRVVGYPELLTSESRRESYRASSGTIAIINLSVCRITVNWHRAPTCASVSRRCRSSTPATGFSSSATITSPSRNPARRAGLRSSSPTTTTPLSFGNPKNRTTRRCTGTVCAETPIQLRRIRPSRSNRLATNFAVLIPIAKQIPCAGRIVAVFTPITAPDEFTNGPPEFPGFNAASV